jgi:hypothetical protein
LHGTDSRRLNADGSVGFDLRGSVIPVSQDTARMVVKAPQT